MFHPNCSSTLSSDAVQRSQPLSVWRPRQSCPSKNASSRSTSVRRRAPVFNALNISARFEIHEALWQLRFRNEHEYCLSCFGDGLVACRDSWTMLSHRHRPGCNACHHRPAARHPRHSRCPRLSATAKSRLQIHDPPLPASL
jgi:hypothetical protein